MGEVVRVGSVHPPSGSVADGADGVRRGRVPGVPLLSRPGHTRPDEPGLQGGARPVRPQLPGGDQSQGPSPAYTEEERRQLLAEGKDLFFSRTAFGQQPSQGPLVFNQARLLRHVPRPGARFCGRADASGDPGPGTRRWRAARRRRSSAWSTPRPTGGTGATRPSRPRPEAPSSRPWRCTPPGNPPDGSWTPWPSSRPRWQCPRPCRDGSTTRRGRRGARCCSGRPARSPTRPESSRTEPMVACATCHAGPFFTDGKAHREPRPDRRSRCSTTGEVRHRRHHRRVPHPVAARRPPHRAVFPRRQRRGPHGPQQLLLRVASDAIPSTGTSARTGPPWPGGPCSTTCSPSTTPSASTSGSPTRNWPISPSSFCPFSPSRIGAMRTLRLLLPLALVTQVFVARPGRGQPVELHRHHDRRGSAAGSRPARRQGHGEGRGRPGRPDRSVTS